ncbi:MAG: histidine phosphatase family protein [Candidatus Ornithospirochaeta sp.]|nr:histidine phosphatase family protein [Candidatus Ornithospirochaeta sp.]
MKLLIVRHAEPDYERDSLTERGWIEAEALSERLAAVNADEYYVSPLGRARDTASLTLERTGREASVKEWLREFDWPCRKPRLMKSNDNDIAWDWLPADWADREAFHDRNRWFSEPELAAFDIKSRYDWVTGELDGLLAEHGYRRQGSYYKAEKPNSRTIVFFCHFGLECVLLSHLVNISPMDLWHGFVAAPSSVTSIATEEREKGNAYWRINAFGDISHLYAKGIEPSFYARFKEVY